MAGKKRCYLCGGKLTEGYCPACGLDNKRIHRKHYHLNESDSVESMNGDDRKASKKCRGKTEQADKKADLNSPRPVESPRNTGGRSLPTSGIVKIVVSVIGLVVVLVGFLSEYVPHNILSTDNSYQTGSAAEYDYENEYSDPYEFVERDLSETGEHYEAELEKGEYLIGVHLPEGTYTAKLLEGNGSLNVDDFENGIYLWQAFGTDEEYDEVETMEDIRLYTGARVTVDDGVILQMFTENGQTEQMETMANPLTEAISLEKDETLTVGEDLSAGVYDISDTAGWAVLRCKVPDKDYEEGYYERSYWLSENERDNIYRNLYLTDGMEITAEESGLLLTPSETVGSGDYKEYYMYY